MLLARSGVGPMKHRHSILLVEDDAATRNAVADLMADDGVRIRRARDGREAIRKLRGRSRPCLVLLDLLMPGMNGWEFLDFHRNHESLSSIPLVIVTAWVNTGVAQARALVSKPIDAQRLLATARGILKEEERRRARRAPVAGGSRASRRAMSRA